MWGYITATNFSSCPSGVPSLYVRVYRQPSITLLNLSRSLIICEGISYTRNAGGTETAFPHYMWGYIGAFSVGLQGSLVPSLYVRVYHGRDETPEPPRSSLIICEDISAQSAADRRQQPFPHYMWGYIPPAGRTAKRSFVPSLYMRVYRNRQWHPSGNINVVDDSIPQIA